MQVHGLHLFPLQHHAPALCFCLRAPSGAERAHPTERVHRVILRVDSKRPDLDLIPCTEPKEAPQDALTGEKPSNARGCLLVGDRHCCPCQWALWNIFHMLPFWRLHTLQHRT